MASRNTAQRRIVEEQLYALANHPTAEQVYDAVHAQYPKIGKATVYRTLNKLADEGLAQRVRINNGADCFDYKTHKHYHVRCTVCGRVEDVEGLVDDELDITAANQTGFEIVGHSLQFDGICPECRTHLTRGTDLTAGTVPCQEMR